MENYFGIFVIFGRWNQRKQGPTASTSHHGAPLARGGASWAHCKLVGALLRPQGSLYQEKNRVKILDNRSYGSPDI